MHTVHGGGRAGGGIAGGDAQQSSPAYPTPAPKQLSWHVRAASHAVSLLHLFARPQLQLQSRPLLTISAVGVSVHTVQGGGIDGGGGEGSAAGGDEDGVG